MVTCCSSPPEWTKTASREMGRVGHLFWAGLGRNWERGVGAVREHGREKLGLECRILAGRLF